MKANRFVLALLGAAAFTNTSNAIYTRSGFDWAIGNTHGTVYGKRCGDITWYRVDGTIVPNSEIICCNFSAGQYTSGINCPFAMPVDPLSGGDVTKDYVHNEYVNERIKVATKRSTGQIDIVDYHNGLSLKLLDPAETDGPEEMDISVSINDNTIDIAYYPVSNNEIRLDAENPETQHRYYNLQDMIAALYEQNLANMINLFPNPSGAGELFTIKNLLYAYHDVVQVEFYNLAGKLIASYELNAETIQASLPKGQYKAIITLNETCIKGNIDFLVTGSGGE